MKEFKKYVEDFKAQLSNMEYGELLELSRLIDKERDKFKKQLMYERVRK